MLWEKPTQMVLVVAGYGCICWLPRSGNHLSGRYVSALRTLHPALLDSGSGFTGWGVWAGHGAAGVWWDKILVVVLSRGVMETRIA